MDDQSKKIVPRMDEYKDEGTWVWAGLVSKYRLVISHLVGERKQYMADKIVAMTSRRLGSMPLFVTDGLKFYTKALLKQYGKLVEFPPTGKRGRPKKPKVVPDENLKYAQIIKRRKGGHVSKVVKKVIFGKDVNHKMISTNLIERQNLTFRQDNNRISRKTLGFSKKIKELANQMTLYFANFNFCRPHGSLKKHFDECGRVRRNCPAKEYGLIDHNWTLRELLTYPYHKTSTN